MEICFDEEIMKRLITLAPPGLHEMMAMMKLMEKEMKQFTNIILDTAPTGHMLRFLELPNLAQDWFRVFFSLLYKYRGIVSLYNTGESLLYLSTRIQRLRKTLLDPKKTGVLVVTLPEKIVFKETEALLLGVKNLGLKAK